MSRPKNSPKFKHFAAAWLETKRYMLSYKDYQRRLQPMLSFVGPHGEKSGFANKRLDRITHDEILEWMLLLRAGTEKTPPRYAASTATDLKRQLAAIFREARRKGYLTPEMPEKRFGSAEAVPGSRLEKPLKMSQAAKIYQSTELGAVHHFWWLLFLFTGMRINEVRGLWWSEVDWDMEPMPAIRVAYAMGRGTPRRATKTRAAKLAPIHPQFLPFLRAWQDLVPKKTGHVLVDVHGRVPSEDRLRKTLKRDLGATGIKSHHTPHHLRHTFCTLVGNTEGINVPIVKRITHAPEQREAHTGYWHVDYRVLCREFSKFRIKT